MMDYAAVDLAGVDDAGVASFVASMNSDVLGLLGHAHDYHVALASLIDWNRVEQGCASS